MAPPLTIDAPALLTRPAPRVLLEWYLEGSHPYRLPANLAAGPVLLASDVLVGPTGHRPRVAYEGIIAATLGTARDGVTPAATFAHWRLSDAASGGTTTTAADVMGVHNGTYENGPTHGVAGATASIDADTAVTFNGSTQLVTVASATALDIPPGGSLVAWLWAKRGALPAASLTDMLLARVTGSLLGWGVEELDDGTVRATVIDGAVSVTATTTTALATGTWRFVVVVYDAHVSGGERLRLYIDGAREGDVDASALNQTLTLGAGAPLALAAYREGAAAPAYHYDGSLDEVGLAIYGAGVAPPDDAAVVTAWQGVTVARAVHEPRLLAAPALDWTTADTFGGVRPLAGLTCELDNSDGGAAVIFADDARGTLVRVHLVEAAAAEVTADVLVGEVADVTLTGRTARLTLTPAAVAALAEPVPRSRVTVAAFPNAPAATDAPAGGLGSVVPLGGGIGRRVPGVQVNRRTPAEPLPHYDYLLGTGRLHIDRVYAGPTQYVRASGDYEVLPRIYRDALGRYCTAIRFRRPQLLSAGAAAPVTADVRRLVPDVGPAVIGDWLWDGSYADTVGGLATTSDSINHIFGAGPDGVNLGAVQSPAATDARLEVAWSEPVRDLVVEFWLNPETGGAVMQGPQSNSARGWNVYYDATNDRIVVETFLEDYLTSGLPTTIASGNGTVPPDTWTRVVVAWASSGLLRIALFINNALAAFSLSTSPLLYNATPSTMWFGNVSWGSEASFGGWLGPVRLTRGTVSAAYLTDGYYRMRRSPVRLLRDIFRDAGAELDDTSWDATEVALDAIGDGALRADGWLTTEGATAADVLEAVAPVRDLVLDRTTDGRLTLDLAAAPATAAAAFSTEPPLANILALVERTRTSTADAVAVLPLAYRLERDEVGAVRGYGVTVDAEVGAVGQRAATLELPFVADHETADRIRDFQGKRLAARAERLTVDVGHEGRHVRPGDVVVLTAPAWALTAAEYEVLAVSRAGAAVRLVCAPYAATAYTYDAAATLPADAPDDPDDGLSIGNAAEITALQIEPTTGRQIRVDVLLADADPVVPVAMTATVAVSKFGGAGSIAASLADTSDTTGVELDAGQPGGLVVARCSAGSGTVAGTLAGVTVRVRARWKSGSSGGRVRVGWYANGRGAFGATLHDVTASWAEYEQTFATVNGEAWTAADIAALEARCVLDAEGAANVVQLARLEALLLYEQPLPATLGAVTLYRIGASDPVPPTTTTPTMVLPYLRGIIDTVPGAGSYRYVARVYDTLSRLVGTLGPSATVTVS